MDPRRFDRLTRLIGAERSRRGVLKAIAGGAIGALAAAVGRGETEAAVKRAVGNACATDSDCASDRCVQESRTRRICHCQSPADCPAAKDACHSAVCLPAGYCSVSINAGAPCDDRDACTQTDACDSSGVCAGANPVVCQPLDQCHVTGSCAPATGVCSNPNAPDNTACGTGRRCCGGTCCPNVSDACFGGGCCPPDAKPTTCAGKCGVVVNNCGQSVDCGGCDASQCLTCGAGNACVSTCGTGQACCGGSCKQAAGSSCANDGGCCSGVCVAGTCEAGCSAAGGPCDDATDCCEGTNCIDIVTGAGVCCAGAVSCDGTCCQTASDLCTAAGCCTPETAAATCAGKCGTVTNNCGQSVDCTARCQGCCSGGACEPGTTDAACGGGGRACVACSTSDPVCGGPCSANFHICSYAGSHTSCGHNNCDNGTVTYAGACDGAGACQPGASFSCAPYQCNDTGTTCLGDCGGDPDCVSGYYCRGIECVPAQANGAPCSDGRQCASGNCVDSTCCASASCGSCESCAAGNGSCASTCGSGQVCCNGACKVHGGYPCSGDSDCCLADGYGCPSTFCCTFKCGAFTPPDTVCCSAGNNG